MPITVWHVSWMTGISSINRRHACPDREGFSY